ncbi:MAG: Phosphoribosylamine--glycine ligase [Gemmatimonadetes bacterium]|nr:Phosphoribosylamine--glycine ligase [Gemmatimonadota bacterium]
MIILVVGGGGREHALCWKLKQENANHDLHAAPGNPGIAELATCHAVDLSDLNAIETIARELDVDFTIVGPEAPLAAGIVDLFRFKGLAVFGPTQGAAEIETSKSFAKELMTRVGVPTARAEMFEDAAAAKQAARAFGLPVVIKASGLAAGKGVVVSGSLADADRAIDWMLTDRAFGESSSEVLVEEFMAGEELSYFALTDGYSVLPLAPSQDHKRLLAGDAGPNTGGMGAYSPVSLSPGAVNETVLLPTLRELARRDRKFTGLLYAGLMIENGESRVVEFNCRFGDPETEAVLPVSMLEPSLGECLYSIARGELLPSEAKCTVEGFAVTTVLAAAGYPARPVLGAVIDIPRIPEGVLVFHAGTKRDDAGRLVVSGGRVLAVTGLGATLEEAQERSLDFAEAIEFEGKQYRADIGFRELARRATETAKEKTTA